jgi:hypothetical protein
MVLVLLMGLLGWTTAARATPTAHITANRRAVFEIKLHDTAGPWVRLNEAPVESVLVPAEFVYKDCDVQGAADDGWFHYWHGQDHFRLLSGVQQLDLERDVQYAHVATGLFAVLIAIIAVLVVRRFRYEPPTLRRLFQSGAVSPGLRLHHFILGAELGRGASASVYEARRLDSLDQTAAIKVFFAASSEEGRLKMEREVRVWRKLSHPNIVHLLDWGQVGDLTYLVMDRIEGETLADCIRSGPLDAERLQVVATQLLDALFVVHAHHLVHCDVKPSNLMLTPQGRLLLMDFGISMGSQLRGPAAPPILATGDSDTKRAVVSGTPGYLAPERLGGADVDWRSDLYSAGVTIYEVATGHLPCSGSGNGASPGSAGERVMSPSLHEARPDLPGDFCRLVDSLLSADPERRTLGFTSEVQASMEAIRARYAVQGPIEPLTL